MEEDQNVKPLPNRTNSLNSDPTLVVTRGKWDILKKVILHHRLATAIRNWTFTLLVLMLAIIFTTLIIIEVNDSSYRIQSFTMPQVFLNEGYDGTATAYLLLDKLNEIISEGNHTRSITEVEQYNQIFDQQEVRVEVSGIGVSPEGIAAYIKKFLGISTTTISGEFVTEGHFLTLFLRISGEPTQTIHEPIDSTGRVAAFKRAIQHGAESILKLNNPTLLALYYGGNNDPRAIQAFRYAVQKHPHNAANIYAWWGEYIYWRDNDTTYALPKIRKALSIDKNNAAAYNIWGNMVYHYPFEENEKRLRKAIELDHKCVACWNDLGAVLVQNNQSILSQKGFDSLKTDPIFRTREQEAITCFKKCYALDDTYASSLSHWAFLLFYQGKLEEANEKAERLSYIRTNFSNRIHWAIALAQSDKFEATFTYEQLRKEYTVSELISFLNDIAYQHELRGNYTIGFTLVKAALQMDSTTKAAMFPYTTIAELELLTSNKEGFYNHFEKALQLGYISEGDLLKTEPYRSLKKDERFQELLKKYSYPLQPD